MRDLVCGAARPVDAPYLGVGIKVKIHCAGAGTVDLDLDAYAEVRRVNGPGGPAHEIAHCTYISDEDYARFCELNVIAEMSPAVWHVPEFQEFHSAPARPPLFTA